MSNRVLVISNNAFDKSDSNGRTLGKLFEGYNKDEIIQLCINGNSISPEYIEKSFKTSDKMVIKGLFNKSCPYQVLPYDINIDKETNQCIKVRRTPLILLIRELVWNLVLSRLDFNFIIKHFVPNIIVVQLGDASFLLRYALQISKKYNCKIVIFTTEDYYFKNWNYMQKDKKSFFFIIFHKYYKKNIKKIFSKVDLCVANTTYLAELYKAEFNVTTEVIMTSSKIEYIKCNNFRKAESKSIIYAGNLGLDRYKSLIEIAKSLFMIDKSFVLEIYGYSTLEMRNEFCKYKNINYCGFKPYNLILDKIKESFLAIHCESFDPFYCKDLRMAFSTKISDILSSGTPLFMLADKDLAETKYLLKNNCAFVCTDKKNIQDVLYKALRNEDLREDIVNNAIKTSLLNHNEEINKQKFLNLLDESIYKKGDCYDKI